MQRILLVTFLVLAFQSLFGQTPYFRTYSMPVIAPEQISNMNLINDKLHVIQSSIYQYTRGDINYAIFDLEGNLGYIKQIPWFYKDKDIKPIIEDSTMWILGSDYYNGALLLYQQKLNGDSISVVSVKDPQNVIEEFQVKQFLSFGDQKVAIANGYLYPKDSNFYFVGCLIFINNDFSVDTIVTIKEKFYNRVYDAEVGVDGLLTLVMDITCNKCPIERKTTRKVKKYNLDKELVWEYATDTFDNNHYPSRLKMLKDNSAVFVHEDPDNWNHYILRCVNADSTIKWEYNNKINYETRIFNNIYEGRNGDIFSVGSIGLGKMENDYRFAETADILKISSKGELLWEHIFGKYLPNNTMGVLAWAEAMQEDEKGNIYLGGKMDSVYDHPDFGIIPDENIFIARLDSFGCIDQDKCNEIYVIDPPPSLHQYDQIDMKHKDWYYRVEMPNGTANIRHYTIGQDTIIFDQKFGQRKYRFVKNSNAEDTETVLDSFRLRWDVKGKVFFMERWRFESHGVYLPNDSVLYDFTLNLGDHFQFPRGFGMGTVTMVDEVSLLDGFPRKRITLHHDNPQDQLAYGDLVWIEGIGATSGLFYFYDWTNNTKTSINCYYDRDKKRWGTETDCKTTRNATYKLVSENSKYVVDFLNIFLDHEILIFTFEKDSVLLDGQYYHKLVYTKNGFPTTLYSNGDYYRQEGNKVFKKINVNTPERLLYDFDLEIGAELVPNPNNLQGIMTITDIDTITMENGSQRKLFTVYCEMENADYYWIEGMGDLAFMLFADGNCSIQDGGYYPLICYHYNDELVYINPLNSDCMLLGTNNPEASFSRVYPNPVSKQLNVESNMKIDHVQVSNVAGQSMKIDFQNNTINTSDFQAGMYILMLQYSSGAVEYLKFVKSY